MKHFSSVIKSMFILALCCSPFLSEAKNIDFDKAYGAKKQMTMVQKMNKAIQDAQNGDVLVFNSSAYDFEGKSFTIKKAITISGKATSFDPSKVGAQNVTTVFQNLRRINVQSNNVKFKHIDIRATDGTGYFIFLTHPQKKVNVQYKGILFENSILRNASVLAYGGNGVGVTYKNLSCYDFTRGAFLNDRRLDNNYSNKMHFEKCYFRPNQETLYFDTRAISFDAGNDEHAVTWNLFNTTIKDNVFDGAGVAFSKCRNAIVSNNHFKGYSMYIDMVHMEEFTNNITVTENIFEYVKPARGFYIDREGQPCHHITITNNTFLGKIGWVISTYSPSHLVFENNDFTGAHAHKPNGVMFDFNCTHRESHFPIALPLTKVSIKNNPGLNDATKFGKLAYTQVKGDKSVTIEGYASNKIVRTESKSKPKSLVESGKIYRIQNIESGEFIAASSKDTKVVLTSKKRGKAALWKVTFRYPYTYTFQNVETGNYLEVIRGYNLADRRRNPVPKIFVEQKETYEKTPQPAFFLRQKEENSESYFEILPGSNEQKSRITIVDESVELELAANKGLIPATESGKWLLVSVK